MELSYTSVYSTCFLCWLIAPLYSLMDRYITQVTTSGRSIPIIKMYQAVKENMSQFEKEKFCCLELKLKFLLFAEQGLCCSRCQYSDRCQGCPISRESLVHLRPGDCLSVCLSGMSETCIGDMEGFTDHKTMEQLRPEKSLSVYDCLQAFTDR